MATHSQTTELLDKTIEMLSSAPTDKPTNLIQQWITTLNQAENTRDLAGKLSELDKLLKGSSPDSAAIHRLMNELADATQEFSAEVGPEGELPSQLEGLASALRSAGDQLKS